MINSSDEFDIAVMAVVIPYVYSEKISLFQGFFISELIDC